MLIIPAIDILDGRCVRLLRGNYDRAREYNANPADVARQLEGAGAKRIHVVDLDAARGAGKNNRNIIGEIAKNATVEIEVGGGVRSEDDIDALAEAGVDNMIVGTALAKEPDVVARWVSKYGEMLIAGIDACDGEVRVSGWEERSALLDVELGRTVADMGICCIVYTSISVDGTLAGPDIERTNRMAETSGVDVILSGGIGGISDVKRVVETSDDHIIGMIAGKALYEGALDLGEALEAASPDE